MPDRIEEIADLLISKNVFDTMFLQPTDKYGKISLVGGFRQLLDDTQISLKEAAQVADYFVEQGYLQLENGEYYRKI